MSLLILAAMTPELCLLDTTRPDCRAVEARRIALAPAAHERPFAAWNAERTELTLGTLPANATTIDLGSDDWRTIDLALAGDDAESWPQPVQLKLGTVETTIGANAATSLRRIRVQAKDGELALTAPHHRPVTRALSALGNITFQRYPRVSGSVVDAVTGAPASGANIVLPSGTVLTTTAIDGRFAADVTSEWPAFLRIETPHRAARTISVPRAVRSFDAGTVMLSRGGAIRLVLDREADVELFRIDGDERIATGNKLDALEPATYEVHLRGKGPLQRYVERVDVTDGATVELQPRIRAAKLVLRSVPHASIEIGPATNAWLATIDSGEDGVNELELWQQGEYAAFVKAAGATGFAHQRLSGVDEIEWTIRLPEGRVEGVVLNAEGKPVEGAEVQLENEGAQVRTSSDAQGRFAFHYVDAGRQTLTANASGFAPATRTFDLDGTFSATLRLERATTQGVIVTLANGRPAANAPLVDAQTGHTKSTAADGSAMIDLRAGEQKTLYVLPVEGSFATIEVAASREAAPPLRVTVPPPDATIIVRARSNEGDAIGNVFFAVRYNGRVLSDAVRQALTLHRGIPFHTGGDGAAVLRNMPAGLYEIWPYTSSRELQAIEWGTGGAPVKLAARAGENEVLLTFTREEKTK